MNLNDHTSTTKTESETDTALNPSRPWLSGLSRLSIEEGGIERVTDEERLQNTTKFWNAATFW